jgi:hypothetical protein
MKQEFHISEREQGVLGWRISRKEMKKYSPPPPSPPSPPRPRPRPCPRPPPRPRPSPSSPSPSLSSPSPSPSPSSPSPSLPFPSLPFLLPSFKADKLSAFSFIYLFIYFRIISLFYVYEYTVAVFRHTRRGL